MTAHTLYALSVMVNSTIRAEEIVTASLRKFPYLAYPCGPPVPLRNFTLLKHVHSDFPNSSLPGGALEAGNRQFPHL